MILVFIIKFNINKEKRKLTTWVGEGGVGQLTSQKVGEMDHKQRVEMVCLQILPYYKAHIALVGLVADVLAAVMGSTFNSRVLIVF